MASKKEPDGTTRGRVAALYRDGIAPRQIAETLGITVQAVSYHTTRIVAACDHPQSAQIPDVGRGTLRCGLCGRVYDPFEGLAS